MKNFLSQRGREFEQLYLRFTSVLVALRCSPCQACRASDCRTPGAPSPAPRFCLLNLALLCSSIAHREQHVHFPLNKTLGDSPSQPGLRKLNVMKTASELRVGKAGMKYPEWILTANTELKTLQRDKSHQLLPKS